jgi:hypothetical protein
VVVLVEEMGPQTQHLGSLVVLEIKVDTLNPKVTLAVMVFLIIRLILWLVAAEVLEDQDEMARLTELVMVG